MVHGIAVNIMHCAVICFSYLLMFPEELFVQSVYSVKIFMMKGVKKIYIDSVPSCIGCSYSTEKDSNQLPAYHDYYRSKGSKLYRNDRKGKVEYKYLLHEGWQLCKSISHALSIIAQELCMTNLIVCSQTASSARIS